LTLGQQVSNPAFSNVNNQVAQDVVGMAPFGFNLTYGHFMSLVYTIDQLIIANIMGIWPKCFKN